MSKKTDDLGLKIGSTNINNMGITALKYRNNAPNDKSFRASILGINQKFTDDVPGDKRAELITRYSIPETVEAGADNYYTIKINGEFYVTIQNGNFKLYDKVMAYLPNGDWSRMYLDYPVNYTESVTLHVFTQAEEPEEDMNVNDLWFELDENENIVALYHYGLNEDTQENEWIFDGKVESGGTGTGKWLDDAHTSVAHNDHEHNTSTRKYDSVMGKNNSLTGTTGDGANIAAGKNNTVSTATNSVIVGENANITSQVQDSFINGDGTSNSYGGITYSVVITRATTQLINQIMDSCVIVYNGYLSEIKNSVIVGQIKGGNNYAAAPMSGCIVVTNDVTINYSYQLHGCIISGERNTIQGIDVSIVSGRGNVVSGAQASIISGYTNTVSAGNGQLVLGEDNDVYARHCAVVGEGNYCRAADCIMCGRYGTTEDHSYYFVIGNGFSSSNRSNVFTVDAAGNVNATGTITPGGADWAETYEWLDGNPDNEDRRGLFVTLDGAYIKLATAEDDYILGAVSATPSVCGDTYDLHWKGKYKKDIFGVIQTDEEGKPILADDFDPELKYVPQSNRKEKAKVGTQGKIVVVDDGTCVVNKYCKPSVNGIGTYTDDKNYYRVIERLDDTHIKIVIK